MIGRKRWGALTLFFILTSCSSFAAGSSAGYEAVGVVMVKDDNARVVVNKARVLSGTTLFKGDVLETAQGATAILKLRSGASVTLSPEGELAIEATPDSDTMNLRQGSVYLRSSGPQPERVSVVGTSILVRSDAGFPAICRIAALRESAVVSNEGGHVEIHGAGAPLILPVGKHATLEAGRPQGGGQQAGTVSNVIPTGTLEHNNQTEDLKVQEAVFWNDTVHTRNTGRARIALGDGSFLNIGVRSDMKILKHDVQSQQTAVELTVGKMRGEVVKLTKPGASFQVTTQTAVIGVVGTTFVVYATPKMTRIWCIEGLVKVWNIDPAVVGEILLHAGEFTTVLLHVPPAAAVTSTPGQLHAQMQQTDATGTIPPTVYALSVASHIGTIGASAAAAAGAAVAISRSDNAKSVLNQVGPILTNASNSSTQSTNSANAAAGNSAEFTGVMGNLLQFLSSPTYPCGCR